LSATRPFVVCRPWWQRLATERKSLDDLETVNKTLEQDVARFRALQENKKKLDAFRGKVLWVEADVVRERADNAKTVLGAVRAARPYALARHRTAATAPSHHRTTAPPHVSQKEAELKDIKNEVKKRESACKPLEEARDKHEKQLRSVNGKNREADDQRMRSQQPLQKLMDEQVRAHDPS
jgi:hypothetical protein